MHLAVIKSRVVKRIAAGSYWAEGGIGVCFRDVAGVVDDHAYAAEAVVEVVVCVVGVVAFVGGD